MPKRTTDTPPTRGNWEATMRNIRALKTRVAGLAVRVRALERRDARLFGKGRRRRG